MTEYKQSLITIIPNNFPRLNTIFFPGVFPIATLQFLLHKRLLKRYCDFLSGNVKKYSNWF